MLEESIPAVWASMNSWFTPTLLFVFLNLMIGTIAVASGGFGTQKQNRENNNDNQQPGQLLRSPSLLQRVKSINLYRYKSQELNPFSSITTTTLQPSELEHTQQVLDTFNIPHDDKQHTGQFPYENLDENHHLPMDETYHNIEDHHVTRTLSDTKPASGDIPVKLSKKMKKSASTKSAFAHFGEQEVVQVTRPATVREGKSSTSQSFGDDEEVDAKADDFINKFKNQLKLQRLDSIIRYKEMLGRGADK
ncbi:hypothetical protein IFM89_015689 [Coptis chinensis]|uniref:DUF4408 domain-containing protein n=1 Tax=Coptis chinensis TaxID=261450 RepID=A0A835IB15_9MAGN|nr:hypothetical protein IFM89_015689 [Coptis chinensis]